MKAVMGKTYETRFDSTRQCGGFAAARSGNHFSAQPFRDTSAAQTNYVPDGASWPTAFETVQEAIHAASYGEAVRIAAGTDGR